MYKKRPGTSGIRGQLYEIKLLSLINFRAKHDDRIEHFNLATNVDKIGLFDDVCFRAKVKGVKRPVAVFLQAKHTENEKVLEIKNKLEFAKQFDSYMKIRQSFKAENKEGIFKGEFDEIECRFVIYTPAKIDSNIKMIESNFAKTLNDLIATADTGICKQPALEKNDVDCLCQMVLKEQITALAGCLAKLYYEEVDPQMFMSDELISCYHVILAEKVVDVSEKQTEGHRNASLRQDFIDTKDDYLLLFKDSLYKEILRRRKLGKEKIKNLLYKFFNEPLDKTVLSELIVNVIMYDNGKLKFVHKMSEDFKRRLDKIQVSQSAIYEALNLGVQKIVIKEDGSPKTFKVSCAFGNKDLLVRNEKRLEYLTKNIVDLLKNKSNSNNIVTIDETVGNSLLQLNGGLGSAVGNILILDETTKLMKFTDDTESELAKKLLQNLRSEISDLRKYRIDVKVKNFPKLSFDIGEYEKNMVKDFLSKLLFYTSQADEKGVENILKSEIEGRSYKDVHIFQASTEAILLKYNDEVKNWWMVPKEAVYLTKQSKMYENSFKNIVNEPLLTVLNTIHKIKTKNIEFKYNENAINSLKLPDRPSGTLIVTDAILLTLYKVKQLLKNKDHVVLDLEYILYLKENDYSTLLYELTHINKDKILVIVCDNIRKPEDLSEKLKKIANAVFHKQTIIITNNKFTRMTKQYLKAKIVVNDKQICLADMTEESQKVILRNATGIFDGSEVNLDTIVDEHSMEYVRGHVLGKMVLNETIDIERNHVYFNIEKIRQILQASREAIRIKNLNVSLCLHVGLRLCTQNKSSVDFQPLFQIKCSRCIPEMEPDLIDVTRSVFNYTEKLHDIGQNVVHTAREISVQMNYDLVEIPTNCHYNSFSWNVSFILSCVNPVPWSSSYRTTQCCKDFYYSKKFKFFELEIVLASFEARWMKPYMNGYRIFRPRIWNIGISFYIPVRSYQTNWGMARAKRNEHFGIFNIVNRS